MSHNERSARVAASTNQRPFDELAGEFERTQTYRIVDHFIRNVAFKLNPEWRKHEGSDYVKQAIPALTSALLRSAQPADSECPMCGDPWDSHTEVARWGCEDEIRLRGAADSEPSESDARPVAWLTEFRNRGSSEWQIGHVRLSEPTNIPGNLNAYPEIRIVPLARLSERAGAGVTLEFVEGIPQEVLLAAYHQGEDAVCGPRLSLTRVGETARHNMNKDDCVVFMRFALQALSRCLAVHVPTQTDRGTAQ